jgi:RNA polymerase sigma-70 factor (ECF subfamily)
MLARQGERAHRPEEAGFLAGALQGDEAAIRSLIQRHNRRLYRLARSIVRNDSEAEDVVQDAYVRAFTNLATFRGESGFGTWLARIVINEALGRLRRRRATVNWATVEDRPALLGQLILFPLGHQQADPERTMAQGEIRSMLEQVIDDLPDAFRTVLVARVIEEMSVEETAAVLNLRPETVKTRLHRARKLVRRALEQRLGPALTETFPFEGQRCARMADAVVRRLAFLKSQ